MRLRRNAILALAWMSIALSVPVIEFGSLVPTTMRGAAACCRNEATCPMHRHQTPAQRVVVACDCNAPSPVLPWVGPPAVLNAQGFSAREPFAFLDITQSRNIPARFDAPPTPPPRMA